LDLQLILPKNYKVKKLLGRGSFGVVCEGEVTNGEDIEKVAIKKMLKIFREKTETKRLLREIKLLRFFSHDNIIKIKTILNPMKVKQIKELYIVTELMESDLQQIIHTTQPLTNDHVSYFMYQLLGVMRHMHSAGIVHRDLKPNNILINKDCDVKLCDFGLARGGVEDLKQEPPPGTQPPPKRIDLTEYVTMRYYRAPELLLVSNFYSTAIDIWSCGCIFGELLNRKPLFAAKVPHLQLSLIIQHLGKPDVRQMTHVKSLAAREAI